MRWWWPILLLVGCTELPIDPDVTSRGEVRFAFPVRERDTIGQVIGVDHDPEEHPGVLGSAVCTNYDGDGFPACYDGHDGSDYMLIGGFEAMDAGSSTVIAAADGVVVDTADGNYDRCHADVDAVSCDGFPRVSNKVIVEHASGVTSQYYHLMSGSLLVEIGDEVRCGQPLARIGSSGNSSAPHLHFQVEDRDGLTVDPYAGAVSGPVEWWVDQGPKGALPASVCAPW